MTNAALFISAHDFARKFKGSISVETSKPLTYREAFARGLKFAWRALRAAAVAVVEIAAGPAATEKQLAFIARLARRCDSDLHEFRVWQQGGRITKAQASSLIDDLKSENY